ncbi:hypothetical protein P8452_41472 [Trifolium repens]|nr:hypothetical protein P8452_23246 [Trifolium repens]WJX55739.1 hypothetical protein P8452_41472 [Trifolium repens]
MKQYIRSRIGKEEEFRAGERTVFAYGVTSSGKTHSMHFSSLGSLDEKWMVELASSMSAGLSEDRVPLGMGEPQIIWPTVEDVRCSIEGYAAGSAIPSPLKNVEKAFLKKYWEKWKANHTGRTLVGSLQGLLHKVVVLGWDSFGMTRVGLCLFDFPRDLQRKRVRFKILLMLKGEGQIHRGWGCNRNGAVIIQKGCYSTQVQVDLTSAFIFKSPIEDA